ncbi:MAG: ATP phosphoribosyltransferase regulatory subunit, partial [Rhodospirillales bacterium]|nr:ATP phosphoribosyltransferase regulatory subunit [Rhodospirillales bacterium]
MDATNDNASKALLPAGMNDTLPPHAAYEASVVEKIMTCFGGHGYERVKPPLLEFEENLLRGPGAAMANQTFRLMDPVSQRMMGLRADITPQVARIATTRLSGAPRPLRLSYAGQILRVKGTQLRADRQFGQVGVELIGADSPVADAEIILMAASALTNLGVSNMSVDLCLPTLVPAVCRDLGLDDAMETHIRAALDGKDAAGITELGTKIGDDNATLFNNLLAATGPVADTITALDALELGRAATEALAPLKAVVSVLQADAPDLVLTADVVENRGWEYHTGVTFTFFTRGVRGELGAGGRYGTSASGGDGDGDSDNEDGIEPATGLTLFMDTLLRAIPAGDTSRRIYLPSGTPRVQGDELRAAGWVTVPALGPASGDTDDDATEAARLGCDH